MIEDGGQRMEDGGLEIFFSGFHLSGGVLPGSGTQALQAPRSAPEARQVQGVSQL